MDKNGAGAGFLRELRFHLPIYIPSASPQSSSLSPEAGTIGLEWPQCQQSHKPNNKIKMKIVAGFTAARVQTRVWSCGILLWTKVVLGQVCFPSTSVSPANLHSICFSTIIFTITRGWHTTAGVAAVPIASQKKKKKPTVVPRSCQSSGG
jgi:hypothetical protein